MAGFQITRRLQSCTKRLAYTWGQLYSEFFISLDGECRQTRRWLAVNFHFPLVPSFPFWKSLRMTATMYAQSPTRCAYDLRRLRQIKEQRMDHGFLLVVNQSLYSCCTSDVCNTQLILSRHSSRAEVFCRTSLRLR